MASDKTRALFAFAKIVIALAAGYGIYTVWSSARAGLDGWYFFDVEVTPIVAGLVVAVVVFFLLSKFNKGSD